MQLTLVQTEIEQALREYVGRQLTVADGTRMTIDLQATRGAEGFKATIDILPGDTSDQKAEPKKETSSVPTPRPPFIGSTSRTPEPEVVAENPTEPVQTAGQETSSQDIEALTASNPNVDSTSTSEGDPTPTPAPPSNTRSLFKGQGLGKPKNN